MFVFDLTAQHWDAFLILRNSKMGLSIGPMSTSEFWENQFQILWAVTCVEPRSHSKERWPTNISRRKVWLPIPNKLNLPIIFSVEYHVHQTLYKFNRHFHALKLSIKYIIKHKKTFSCKIPIKILLLLELKHIQENAKI